MQCWRILDNLPLVVPLRRPDHEYSLVYLHGFLVGLKGQYAGVSASLMTFVSVIDLHLFWHRIHKCWQNKDEKHFVHNHLTFIVKYHRDPVTEMSRIVGFEVKPFRLYYNSFLLGCIHSLVWENVLSYHFVSYFLKFIQENIKTKTIQSCFHFSSYKLLKIRTKCRQKTFSQTKRLVDNTSNLKLFLWIQCQAWIWWWMG